MEENITTCDKSNLPLPEPLMPKCWWNHDEISYFFSPFRSYVQNPLDKENKLKFWKPLIRSWCDYHKRCTFTLFELEKVFQRERLVPACLPGVIEDMLRSGELSVLNDFMKLPQKSWSGWALDILVKKPVVWSWRKAKELAISRTQEEAHYIHLAAAQALADSLLSGHEGHLLSQQELEELCKFKGTVPVADLDMAIHCLLRQGKVAVTNNANGMLVKFSKRNEQATAITELDIGVHALCLTEKTLVRHIEELEAERDQTVETARGYVAKGMRQMAKSCLRKKHELEKCMEKRAHALDNVQVLLSRVREAESDSKILESYQLGVSALKLTFKDANLTEDSASNVMLQVEEILDVQDEIQAALSQSVGTSADEELENELAQLLITDSPASIQNDAIEGLPSPPSSELSSPSFKIPDAPIQQPAL